MHSTDAVNALMRVMAENKDLSVTLEEKEDTSGRNNIKTTYKRPAFNYVILLTFSIEQKLRPNILKELLLLLIISPAELSLAFIAPQSGASIAVTMYTKFAMCFLVIS